jgi:hypothetical protein
MNRLGEGVKKTGSIGSRVIVGRIVAVSVGKGVSVTLGVPVDGVVVGGNVLSTNKSGVFVGSNPNGVTVDCGESVCGAAVCRKGMEGNPVHPERTKITTRIKTSFFIRPLR